MKGRQMGVRSRRVWWTLPSPGALQPAIHPHGGRLGSPRGAGARAGWTQPGQGALVFSREGFVQSPRSARVRVSEYPEVLPWGPFSPGASASGLCPSLRAL